MRIFGTIVLALLVSGCASDFNEPPEYVHVFQYSINGQSNVIKARVVCKPNSTGFSAASGRFEHSYETLGRNYHAQVVLGNGWLVVYHRDAPCMQYGADFRGREVVVENPQNPERLYVLRRNAALRLHGQQFKVERSSAVRASPSDGDVTLAHDEANPSLDLYRQRTYGSMEVTIYPQAAWEGVPQIREAVLGKTEVSVIDTTFVKDGQSVPAWRLLNGVPSTPVMFDGKNFVFSQEGSGVAVWVDLTASWLGSSILDVVVIRGQRIPIGGSSGFVFDPDTRSLIYFTTAVRRGDEVY